LCKKLATIFSESYVLRVLVQSGVTLETNLKVLVCTGRDNGGIYHMMAEMGECSAGAHIVQPASRQSCR